LPEFQPADSDIKRKTAAIEAIASESKFVSSSQCAGRVGFSDDGQFTRDEMEKNKNPAAYTSAGFGMAKTRLIASSDTFSSHLN
jgi:ABC-type tungstate transport system permease subunit